MRQRRRGTVIDVALAAKRKTHGYVVDATVASSFFSFFVRLIFFLFVSCRFPLLFPAPRGRLATGQMHRKSGGLSARGLVGDRLCASCAIDVFNYAAVPAEASCPVICRERGRFDAPPACEGSHEQARFQVDVLSSCTDRDRQYHVFEMCIWMYCIYFIFNMCFVQFVALLILQSDGRLCHFNWIL